MSRATIELPCGCILTETAVVAMCLIHDLAIREAGRAKTKQYDDVERQLRATIDELGK